MSVLFHPLFFVMYMLLLLYVINPYLFTTNDPKSTVLIFVSIISLTVVFPLICIALMVTLGLISGLKMETNKDRVGPMIASGIFYIWLYVNVRQNPNIPDIFTTFLLGSTIALFIGFFINNFTKISLHSIAVAGLVTSLVLLKFGFDYYSFLINIPGFGSYIISTDMLIILAILLAGLMGTVRLFLKAHSPDQIYGGYMVGIFAQLIAFQVVN
ncbi:MAG: hypothetical protein IPL23_11615 [Saprospiraceae bacterium]|nr:hypothetical protein [Saprospiraceae bacterium]MBK8632596.1 hypothetical protein [Saprospiraceae bacterium]MBP7643542.1 hypothetical protein [Saprospiraceae bacterium]HMS67905.1 hypothetical protein [Saprospiraceae bacterium]